MGVQAAARTQAQKTADQKSVSEVVRRLYPYPGKTQNDSDIQPASDSPEDDELSCSDVPSAQAHGQPGHRRLGRPPKATWQYLSEMGARKQRGRAVSPTPEAHPAPRPLAQSEELLRGVGERQSLVDRPRGAPGAPRAPGYAELATARSKQAAQGSCAPRVEADARDVGARLYEQSERQRQLKGERARLAAELQHSEEMRECTFQPQTNRGGRQSLEGSLYERGLKSQMQKRINSDAGAQQRIAAELRDCTFRPAVHEIPVTPSAPYQEPGVPPKAHAGWSRGSGAPGRGDVGQPGREAHGLAANTATEAPGDARTAVMAMLEDWRGTLRRRELNVDDQQAEHAANPAAKGNPHTHVLGADSFERSSASGGPSGQHPRRLGVEGAGNAQRSDDPKQEMDSLLVNWREGWSDTMPQAAESVRTGRIAQPSRLQSPRLHARDEDEEDGHEAHVFAMLDEWRSRKPR